MRKRAAFGCRALRRGALFDLPTKKSALTGALFWPLFFFGDGFRGGFLFVFRKEHGDEDDPEGEGEAAAHAEEDGAPVFLFHRREFGEELDSGGKRGAEKFFHDTGSFRS